MRDAAMTFDVGCLHDHQGGARVRQHAEVHEVPIVGTAIVGRILAHRRDHDAVGKFETRQAKGREQGTGHELDLALAGTRSLAPLDGLQVGNDGTHIACVKAEFRHIWVAGHNALP
jgi:hypothetical protein